LGVGCQVAHEEVAFGDGKDVEFAVGLWRERGREKGRDERNEHADKRKSSAEPTRKGGKGWEGGRKGGHTYVPVVLVKQRL
jgi:hypothetical protein